ncbi:MAG: hypothetical protein J1E05_01725 [Eubacterium sp.]|nr:hypothetical protein [Eubacterium sp.]
MKDNSKLSIDDILRETDEMLKSLEARARAEDETAQEEEDVKEYNPKAGGDDDVKTFVPKKDVDDDVKPYVPAKGIEEDVKAYQPKAEDEEIKTYSPAGKMPAFDQERQAEPKHTVSDKTRTVSEKTRAVTMDTIAGGDSSASADGVKKHYFSSNARDDEYGSVPPQIIERPATIKSKSRFNKTSDLQEIPTILAVDELERTRMIFGGELWEDTRKPESNDNGYDDSDQIKISGFDDEVNEIPDIDEELAEEQLRQRREAKVNKFRLFAKEEVDDAAGGETIKLISKKYSEHSDRTETLEHLYKKKTGIQLQTAITAIIGLLLLLLTVFKDSRYLPSVLGTNSGYYITMQILYGIALITNVSTVIHGFNLRRGFNFDSLIAISSLLTLGHTAALLIDPDVLLEGGAVYPCAATFGLFLSSLGKQSVLTRIIENYDFLTDGKEKYTVEDIVNEVDATIISRNLLSGDPLLKYSVKTEHPTSFLEISCAYEPADRTAKVLVPVALLLNLALFSVIGVLRENWYLAFNVITPGIMISCPLIALYANNTTLLGISKKLAQKGSMVCGFEGAHYSHNSNAIVMEASELFGTRSCDLHGIRLFNKAKVDDALLLTAAVIMKTKSPLKYVFDDVIVGNKEILPEVDGVIYEDKMGTSAWIYQRKILVGNRDLLIHHGISVPKEEYENKYARKGRKALYLAVAGKIAAMFIVSYSADHELKKELKMLEKSGITILLKSCDPYINEESIMDIFDLPEGFIRVMTASNARIFEKYSDITVEKSPAYTVHNGTTLGFLSAIRASENLVGTENMISVLVAFGSAIGFGVVALLGILEGMSQVNATNVIIFQAVWSLFVLLVSKLRRGGL